jgi:hypothetical protein
MPHHQWIGTLDSSAMPAQHSSTTSRHVTGKQRVHAKHESTSPRKLSCSNSTHRGVLSLQLITLAFGILQLSYNQIFPPSIPPTRSSSPVSSSWGTQNTIRAFVPLHMLHVSKQHSWHKTWVGPTSCTWSVDFKSEFCVALVSAPAPLSPVYISPSIEPLYIIFIS